MNIKLCKTYYRSLLTIFLALCLFSSGSLAQPASRTGQTGEDTEEAADNPVVLEEDNDSFTFTTAPDGMELEEVIKMFSEITGKNFIIDEMPKGKVIIIAPKRFKKEQALNIFYAILNINGFNIVETSIPNTYKIIRSAEVTQENIPIFEAGMRPMTSETFVSEGMRSEPIGTSPGTRRTGSAASMRPSGSAVGATTGSRRAAGSRSTTDRVRSSLRAAQSSQQPWTCSCPSTTTRLASSNASPTHTGASEPSLTSASGASAPSPPSTWGGSAPCLPSARGSRRLCVASFCMVICS